MSKESNSCEISPKKIYIRTFGCQMNDRDSEALAGMFIIKGYVLAESPEDADVILVNTCSVRGHAENRAMSFLGSLKKLPEREGADAPRRIIGLIGCMAQALGDDIFKKMRHIDLVCGPADLERVPDYVDRIRENKERVIDLELDLRSEEFYKPLYRVDPAHAQVVISVGCPNYCSYCVVPFVRGALVCRKPEDILDEVQRNVDLGIKKITLLGQNVNDYTHAAKMPGGRDVNFVDLVKKVSDVPGLEELDFVTSHPKNTSVELFQLMAAALNIKKHIHLPFQSGSDRILKLMNRGYTREHYLRIIQQYKEIVGGTISTDVIVGFPTETEEDFLQTKEVLEQVEFKWAYIFKYSPRHRTQAAQSEDDVTREVKDQRHKVLLDLQRAVSAKVQEKTPTV